MKTKIEPLVNLNVNPCKMCMPMGAMTAFYGLKHCVSILHGSQGCSTYIRRHMATHYNEPIDIASSSLTEEGTVYGGEKNLKQGLSNLIDLYHPQVVGVATTCLAETIGEDIKRIIESFYEEHEDKRDVTIIPVHSAGYGGTQYEGYFAALYSIVSEIKMDSRSNNKVNLILSYMSPADVRSIKKMCQMFGLDVICLPDLSENLDDVYQDTYHRLPEHGTPIEDIQKMAGAVCTIELRNIDVKKSPGKYLEETYHVPYIRVNAPVGLRDTDEFLNALSRVSKQAIPEESDKERGRYLDAMIDSHKYNSEGRATVFGEPDFIISTVRLCEENGIMPIVVATGSVFPELASYVEPAIQEVGKRYLVDDYEVIDDADFTKIEELSQRLNANLLIGNSDGGRMEEQLEIPLIRRGFPIHDRVGGQRLRMVGYEGSLSFLDEITNALIARTEQTFRHDAYERYWQEAVKQETEKQGTGKEGTEKEEIAKEAIEKRGTEKRGTEKRGTEKQETGKEETEKEEIAKEAIEKRGTEKQETEKEGTESQETEKEGTESQETEKQDIENQLERIAEQDSLDMNLATGIEVSSNSDNRFKEIEQKTLTHPCYNCAGHKYARMHLPVAPRCNVQCNYCVRKFDCPNESRPGVTTQILTPEEALEKYKLVKEKVPNLTVVGIAGPGDALANFEETKKTLQLIRAYDPEVTFCLSTNGLMLPTYAEELVKLGVTHVTVTVNAVDPKIGGQIYQYVYYMGTKYEGESAGAILLLNQLSGLRILIAHGIICKVNIVTLKGINDKHIPTIVEKMKEIGVYITNIMPMIPVEGSDFEQLSTLTNKEIEEIRTDCGTIMKQMTHCKQCRADAIGTLDQDLSIEFKGYQPRSEQEPIQEVKYRFAVATKNGSYIDEHFGHVSEWYIYECRDGEARYLEKRKVKQYCEGPENCEEADDKISRIIRTISDCNAVITMRIGEAPKKKLAEKRIQSIVTFDRIEDAVKKAANDINRLSESRV